MKKISKKLSHFIFRGAIVAILSRIGLMVLRKVNNNDQLEEKANHIIDTNAEKAKKIAKVGVSKTLHLSKVAQEEIENPS